MAHTQIGAKYTLTGPDGTVAVFNDPTDPNYVGMLTELTGMDSPDVRENAEDLVQMDGGIHGDFFHGRRPITMTGLILNPTSILDRDQKQLKVSRATEAMRGDAILDWFDAAGHRLMLKLRRQQPTRITGAWQKQFMLAMVAADPRIYSYSVQSAYAAAVTASGDVGRAYDKEYDTDYGPSVPTGQLLLATLGTTLTYPVLTIYGPVVNPTVSNLTVGQQIQLNYTLVAGETLVVDTLNRTVKLAGLADRYGAVDFSNTEWWGLVPDTNDIRMGGFGSGASLVVEWRDAWL